MVQKKPSRDTNGKFAKKPENPDCEPATKGYVKCLMRGTGEHKHEHGRSLIASYCGVVIASLILFFSPASFYQTVGWGATIAIGAMCIINIIDNLWNDFTSGVKNREYVWMLAKYEPPKCESPKRDCEE